MAKKAIKKHSKNKKVCFFSFFTVIAKFLFPKKTSLAILNSLIISGVFCSVVYVSAVTPRYNPGETLNPSCLPTESDCRILPVTTYSFGTNNFSGTGNFITSGSVKGISFSIGSNTISSFANLASLAGLSYVSNGFVKMTGANTFALDTNTYASLNVNGYITSDILETLDVDYYISATGPELATNGTFETWSDTTHTSNWDCSGYINKNSWGTIERITDSYSGTYAAKITTGSVISSFTPYIGTSSANVISVTPGEVYTYSFWTKGDGTYAGTYGVYDVTHTRYIDGYGYSTSTYVTATTWTQVTKEITIPAGCTQVKIQVGGNMTHAGAVAYFDSASFKQKALATNYNGVATPLQDILDNFPAVAVKYDGTASGLTSTNVQDAIDEIVFSVATLPVDATNINGILNVDYYKVIYTEVITNGGFELWGASYPTSWGGNKGVNDTITSESTIKYSGNYSAKFTTGANATGYSPNIDMSPQKIAVNPGDVFTFSFYVRDDGTHSGYYGAYCFTTTSYFVPFYTSVGVVGTTWTQKSFQITIPSGCYSFGISLFGARNTAGAVVYYDDVSLKKNTNSNMNGVANDLQSILDDFPSGAIAFDNSTNGMSSTNIQDAIEEAYSHAPSVNFTPRIILPDEVVAVVGDKLQLFTRGMVEAQDPYNLPYNHISSVGTNYPRYYEYTPVVADVGTKTFTMEVRDLNYTSLTTDTMNIVVVNPTGAPASNKNILCVGDSLTTGGTWPAEFYRRLTKTGGTPAGLGYSNITFIGDNPMPGYTTTQAFTGWGGWTWQRYAGIDYTTSGHVLTGTFDKDITDVGATYTDGTTTWTIEYAVGGLKIHGTGTLASSGTLTHVSGGTHTSNIVYTAKTDEPMTPFWTTGTGRFSFADWATRNGYSTIDEAYILLGWNGLSTPNKYLATDHTTMIAYAKVFLDKLHADFPSCKVRIIGLQVPSPLGGLGANYGASSEYTKYYAELRSVNGLRLAYQSLANEAGYSSWVKYLDLASQFDSEYNMPYSATAVNSRNSTTENLGTNGVHPATSGYYQIADVVYRDFIRTECSD